MIQLRKTLEIAKKSLKEAKIDYALIGGFALGAHGIHRATKDIDILIDGQKKEKLKEVLIKAGFEIVFESEEVLQFEGPGYLDILLANRPLSIEMLKTAATSENLEVPVVNAEGIIGLKIQAYKNDPSRKLQDQADIQELLKLKKINIDLIKKYADLFDEWEEIKKLKNPT